MRLIRNRSWVKTLGVAITGIALFGAFGIQPAAALIDHGGGGGGPPPFEACFESTNVAAGYSRNSSTVSGTGYVSWDSQLEGHSPPLAPLATDAQCKGLSNGWESLGVPDYGLQLVTGVGDYCPLFCETGPGPGTATGNAQVGATAQFTYPSSWQSAAGIAVNFSVAPSGDPSTAGVSVSAFGTCGDSNAAVQGSSDLYVGLMLINLGTGGRQNVTFDLYNTTTQSCTYSTGGFSVNPPPFSTAVPRNWTFTFPVQPGSAYSATFYFGCQASLSEFAGGSNTSGNTFCVLTSGELIDINSMWVGE